MTNAVEPVDEIKEKIVIQPFDCKIIGNTRIFIKVKVNKKYHKKAVAIGINPSKAHKGESDTTLTKISRYLYQYGVGELAMINLFETISTNQNGIVSSQKCDLKKHKRLLSDADMIVVAWGTGKKYLEEKEAATCYLSQWSDKVYCIEGKRGNRPRHPSRISYSDLFVKFF